MTGFEVHVNTAEGMWTTVRNFLRPFRGVHKKYLSGYVAMCECGINLKRITPAFISALVLCTESGHEPLALYDRRCYTNIGLRSYNESGGLNAMMARPTHVQEDQSATITTLEME